MGRAATVLMLLTLGAALSWPARDGRAADAPQPTPSAPAARPLPEHVDAPGLHNVFRITPRLYSGSSPEGDEGFRSLQRLGVKTVISVDGGRPEVAAARREGLRYVHLPIGYDGVPREQALRLAKAVRDLPGPIYLHCHHGMHRGPAAAAVIHLCLDESCPVEVALAEMRRAGTDPHYQGLYASAREFRRPTAVELDRLPADFPEVARLPALAAVMVTVDQRWENLKHARAAGWKAPPGHPDVDPPHEALQLQEHYRETARLDSVRHQPAAFRRWLSDGEQAVKELEALLRAGRGKGVNVAAAENAFRTAGASCTGCHGQFRDVPKNP